VAPMTVERPPFSVVTGDDVGPTCWDAARISHVMFLGKERRRARYLGLDGTFMLCKYHTHRHRQTQTHTRTERAYLFSQGLKSLSVPTRRFRTPPPNTTSRSASRHPPTPKGMRGLLHHSLFDLRVVRLVHVGLCPAPSVPGWGNVLYEYAQSGVKLSPPPLDPSSKTYTCPYCYQDQLTGTIPFLFFPSYLAHSLDMGLLFDHSLNAVIRAGSLPARAQSAPGQLDRRRVPHLRRLSFWRSELGPLQFQQLHNLHTHTHTHIHTHSLSLYWYLIVNLCCR
jgi:hypothetical protein